MCTKTQYFDPHVLLCLHKDTGVNPDKPSTHYNFELYNKQPSDSLTQLGPGNVAESTRRNDEADAEQGSWPPWFQRSYSNYILGSLCAAELYLSVVVLGFI